MSAEEKKVISVKNKSAIILFLALCLSLTAGCGSKQETHITVQIDSKQVSYLEAYCLGLGPRTVRTEDDPELVLALIEMFNGEYSYYDTLEIPIIFSAGDPYSVIFYDNSRNEIIKLSFMDDELYVVHKNGKSDARSYDRYKHTEHPLDFASFYQAVYGYVEDVSTNPPAIPLDIHSILHAPVSEVVIIMEGKEKQITDSETINEVVSALEHTEFRLSENEDLNKPGAVSVSIDVIMESDTATITLPYYLYEGNVYRAGTGSIKPFGKYID